MPEITNKEASLREQVQGLEVVLHALNDLFLDTSDPDLTDTIRLRMARAQETLFAKRAQLDAVRAMSVIPEVSQAERDAVMGALAELDRFVLADQAAHAALDLLTQIGDRLALA